MIFRCTSAMLAHGPDTWFIFMGQVLLALDSIRGASPEDELWSFPFIGKPFYDYVDICISLHSF